MATTLQDLINQERRGAVVVTKPLSDVKNASAITNPTAINTPAGTTSQIPSKPIVGDPNNPNFNPLGANVLAQAAAGYGPNDTLSKLWFGIDPAKTAGGGATPPKPVVGSTNTGGTGGTGGMTATEALALAKFNYDKQQDALKLGGLQNYYDSGSLNTGFDALLKMIGDQGAISEGAVKGAYDKAITNVDQGYTAAQNLGDSGYAALNAYLGANQNDPYAGMQATVGSAPDALTQYLSAYGVSDQPVQGQIQADQLQAQQGAGNYQNLINILSGVAQAGASSRGAESAMGQNMFNTTLGQERAGYKTKAEMAQADAMRQIQEAMYQQRLSNESSRNAQMQQLAQALATAGGKTGSGSVAASAIPATVASTTSGGNGDGFVSTSYDVNRPVPFSANPIENIQLQNLATSQSNAGQTVDPYELLAALNARRGY